MYLSLFKRNIRFVWNYRGHNNGFFERGPNWKQITFPPSRKMRRCALIWAKPLNRTASHD